MQVYLCCYCFFGFYIVVLAAFSYIVFTVGQAFTALALVDVLGVFTSEIGFRTPKIRRSDVL